jgi:putative redox protein
MGEDRDELRVEACGGDRYDISIGRHVVTVDQPSNADGQDAGPTPTELFVASLASCVAFYAGRYLRRRGLPGAVEVGAQFALATGPARVASVRLVVTAPGLPDDLRDSFAAVVSHCTVHNSLRRPPEVSFVVHPESGRG